MAINKNHEFEELNGIKCAIVEKNCNEDRVSFLKELLEWNKYTVVVVESPAAKVPPTTAPAPPAVTNPNINSAEAPRLETELSKIETGIPNIESKVPKEETEVPKEETPIPLPSPTYSVGVTDLTFNPINAIFGRILKTKENRIVTQAYWKQQESKSNDEVPYFEMKKSLSNYLPKPGKFHES